MIELTLPGREMTLKLHHLLLDVNGTLSVDGQLIDGVKERIETLQENLVVYLLTADTFGRAADIAKETKTELFKVDAYQGGIDKKAFLLKLGKEHTAAIGNGFNDIHMLEEAALGIAVIGQEGCSIEAIKRADIVVNNINDALDIFINTKRLVATLRA
jgi:P-type E1-E2 ATPase